MRNIRSQFVTILISCAFLFGACDSESVPDVAPEAESSTPAQAGFGDGWVFVEEGLWTRLDEAGGQEFAALGEAGKPHAIANLEQIEAEFARVSEVANNDETRASLVELQGLISGLRARPVSEDDDATTLRCSSIAFGSASAQPSPCGVSANASAGYSNTCGAAGTISAWAGAICDNEFAAGDSCSRTGKSVSCSVSAILNGGNQCTSYAYVEVPGASLWKVNYAKGVCGPIDEGAWGP